MKRARIASLKNNLSRYLDHVRAGGSVLVLDRDQPIAQITPLGPAAKESPGSADRLLRLERRGLIRRGSGGLPDWLGRRRPPRVRGSVLRDLLNDRGRGW